MGLLREAIKSMNIQVMVLRIDSLMFNQDKELSPQ
jgi:hypothetical protein